MMLCLDRRDEFDVALTFEEHVMDRVVAGAPYTPPFVTQDAFM